jgi:hypothetical protein
MAWKAPMIRALLLRTAPPKPAAPLRVPNAGRGARSPSPRGVSASTTSSYKKG